MLPLYKGLIRTVLMSLVLADAVSAVELSITSAAGQPQEQVLLQVEILDGGGVSSGGIVIHYDTAILILEQAILTDLGRQRFAIREDGLSVLPGEIRLGFFTSKPPVVADGVLLELTFAIAAGATFGETDLTLEASGFADATFNPLEPTLLNGQVDVLQPIPPPSASFLSDIAEGDAPLEVQFTDISTGQIDRRTWTFDAGETSQLENPIHLFQERGVYQITLSVSGPGGTDTATADIRVNQGVPVPLAAAGDGTASFDFDLSEGDQQKLELKDVTPGQSVAVQLILQQPSVGSRNLTFVLSFDSQLIIPIDFVPSDVIAGWITLPPLVETNRAEFGVATFTAPPISENGVLGTVNFSLSERFKGQAAIRLEGFSIGPSSTEFELFLPRTTIILSDALSAAPQDFNADGQVDFGDFFLFAEQFGGTNPAFDLDGNQIVDFADFFLFAEQFGTSSR